jgi:hypothetical protein
MTMATILILNVVAVVGLLALLAATMRLPYHLPTSPVRSGATPEAPPSPDLDGERWLTPPAWRARARLLRVGPQANRRRHGQTTATVSTAIAEKRIAR